MAISDELSTVLFSRMISQFYDKKLISRLEQQIEWIGRDENLESEWVRWSKDYFAKKGIHVNKRRSLN